jgi:hypothetical protein
MGWVDGGVGGGEKTGLPAKLGPLAVASIRPPVVAARTNRTTFLVGDIKTFLWCC